MRRSLLVLALPLAAALAAGAFVGPHHEATARADGADGAARGAPGAAPARVALLATRPGALHTSLYLVRPGDEAPPPPLATMAHRELAAVRGAVVPGTDVVLAVADTAETRDLSFASSLVRLAPHQPAEPLCDRVVHASRPLVLPDGRAFVSRGVAGPDAPAGGRAATRVDALTIDEVDPASGASHVVHAFTGWLTFLAGSADAPARGAVELVVYRIGPEGADLVAVDAASGATRTLAAGMTPQARDFSVDRARRAVVFLNRHERDARRWVVDRVALDDGRRERLFEGDSPDVAPYAWPSGGLAFNPDGRSGLAFAGGGPDVHAPRGAGVDIARAEGAGVVAFVHTVQGERPVPFVVDAATGHATSVAFPDGTFVDVAGVVVGGAP